MSSAPIPETRLLRVETWSGHHEHWLLEVTADDGQLDKVLDAWGEAGGRVILETIPEDGPIEEEEVTWDYRFQDLDHGAAEVRAMRLAGPDHFAAAFPTVQPENPQPHPIPAIQVLSVRAGPEPALPQHKPAPPNPETYHCPTCGRIAGLHQPFCEAGLRAPPSPMYEAAFGTRRLHWALLQWLFSPVAFVLGFAVCGLILFPVTGHDSLGFIAAIGFALSCGCGAYLYAATFPGDPILGLLVLICALVLIAIITTNSEMHVQFLWPTESTAREWAIFAVRAVGGLIAIFVGYVNAGNDR